MRQPRTAVQQAFWHPTFDTQKMTKMTKNDVKMIYPKFIQNRSQEVPGPSGHQKTFRRDPENIFPNIEDNRVFWVKRNMPRPFVAGKWKMRFYKPNGFRTPSDRFEYPLTYLNQGGTTQNGCATSILAPDIRHSKNDKHDKKWCENNLSKIHSESVPRGTWTFGASKNIQKRSRKHIPEHRRW